MITFSVAMIVLIAIIAVIFGLGVIAGWRMRRFLARTPELRSAEDVTRFKRLIAGDMYTALTSIILAITGAIILLVSVVMKWISYEEAPILLGAGGVIIFLVSMLWAKPAEARVKQIPTADDELREERDRLTDIWVSKVFPDW